MRPLHLGAAVLVAAIWGFNFVVIRWGLDDFPPILFSALRFLVIIPLLAVVGPRQVPWRSILAVGVVLGVVKFNLLFTGMALGMPPGLTSLVMQAQAFFTAVLAMLVLGERPGGQQWAGMAIAFAGIAVIASEMDRTGGNLMALALCLGAATAWAVANLLMKRAAPRDPLAFIVWVSLVPPVPAFLLSLTLEGQDRVWAALAGITLPGVLAVLWVGIFSTVAGFAIWGWLLRHYSASTVAPFSLLVPIFGLASAAIFLGERLTPLKWAAAGLVLAGLALTVIRRPGPAAGHPEPRHGAAAQLPAPAAGGGAR